MIKNFLYSLFFHSLLFLVLYYSFLEFEKREIVKSNEITISIASFNSSNVVSNQNSDQIGEGSKEILAEKETEISKTPELLDNDQKKSENKTDEKEKELKESKTKDVIEEKEDSLKINEKNEEKIKLKKANEDKASKQQELLQKKEISKISQSKIEDQKSKILNKIDPSFKSKNLKDLKNISGINEGSDLSAREKLNIQSQIKSCYRRAVQESRLDSKVKILIKILISKEGYIENDIDEMIDIEKYNDPEQKDYKIVIDNTKRAIELCSPLRNLPVDKYDIWKEVVLQFDPTENGG